MKMKLIKEFVHDDRQFFTELLKGHIDNIEKFLDQLNLDFNTINVKYYQDDQGLLYKHIYVNGKRTCIQQLTGEYKRYIYDF